MIPEWHNDFRTPSVFSQVAKLRILLRKPPLCPAELRDRKENLAFGDQLHSASRAGVGVAYDRVRRLTRGGFIPGRYSQSCYPEVKHWLPAPGNIAGRFAVSSTYLPTTGEAT